MKKKKKKKILPSFIDKRGEITDILENEKINSITIITFKKGAIREIIITKGLYNGIMY